MNLASVKLISLLFALVLLSGCAGIAVRGTVGGQTIESRVDAQIAHYYLADYLAGRRSDAALNARIDRVYANARDDLPDRHELKRLSDEFSVDFAALYFADRIARTPVYRRFRTDFDRIYKNIRATFAEGLAELPVQADHYAVVFVPGYLYKRHRMTGADLAAPRAALQRIGLTHHFVETVEDGAIEPNAEIVAAAIQQQARAGRRLIVASVSKAGAEVGLALSRLAPTEADHVAAWVNIAGTLQGSPLADEGLLQLEELTGRVNIAGVESLSTERSRQRFNDFHIPEHVLVVNYIGIPLTGSISMWGRSGYVQLRPYGPNDGLSLLSDLIVPGGVTLAELGRDHFLLDGQIDVTTVALALTLIEQLEQRGQ
jgi:hypothetical protein